MMVNAAVDSLTAGNLPKLVIGREELPNTWVVTTYLVPILGGVAPICSTCGGVGLVNVKYGGPGMEIIDGDACPDCVPKYPSVGGKPPARLPGSLHPTSITLTVECDDCHGGRHVVAGSPCPGCDGHLHHRAAAATLLLVLPIARRIGAFDEWDAPYDKGSVPVPRVGLNRSRTQMLLHPGRGLNVSDISALLPLASWETSKWALLVKDLHVESAV